MYRMCVLSGLEAGQKGIYVRAWCVADETPRMRQADGKTVAGSGRELEPKPAPCWQS